MSTNLEFLMIIKEYVMLAHGQKGRKKLTVKQSK